MNLGGDCRTVPATPGLLITLRHRHTLIIEDDAFSHKIYYFTICLTIPNLGEKKIAMLVQD